MPQLSRLILASGYVGGDTRLRGQHLEGRVQTSVSRRGSAFVVADCGDKLTVMGL